MIRRGDLRRVRPVPASGSEIAETGPCLILSSNILNERRRAVFVVPLSRSPQACPPILGPVRCQGQDAVAVTDQIRAVSKERLERCTDTILPEHLEAVERGLREVLELD